MYLLCPADQTMDALSRMEASFLGISVPYHPLLSMLLDCHVNVKVCTGIRLVKYVYKYVNKGGYRCLTELQQAGSAAVDEIKQYVEAR